MAHRIRHAMTQEPLSSKLSGTVEVNETWVGRYEKGRRGIPGCDGKKQYFSLEKDGKMVTANSAQNYFSILKRGIVGVYENVGIGRLHLYLREFDFRYNSCEVSDAERALLALIGSEGKRLTYRD